jgi:predicted transcriptional regulator
MMREEKREQLRRDVLAAWAEYRATGLYLTEAEAEAWMTRLEAGVQPSVPECHP